MVFRFIYLYEYIYISFLILDFSRSDFSLPRISLLDLYLFFEQLFFFAQDARGEGDTQPNGDTGEGDTQPKRDSRRA